MFANRLLLDRLLIIALVIFFSTVLVFNLNIKMEQQHSYLAQSFLKGKTYFLEMPGSWGDTVPFENRYYWAEGPLPAILLSPLVFLFGLVNRFFYQGYFQLFLVFLVFYLLYRIAGKLKYSPSDSLYLSFAFCFSSVFLGVALIPWSWYFSQVLAVFLVLLIIYEYLTKKRLVILGVLSGLLVLTWIPSSFIVLMFFFEILLSRNFSSKKKLILALRLLIPYFIFYLVLFLYNYIRFGSFLEQGYLTAMVPEIHQNARKYGMFSLVHVPGNLYYFLLNPPHPVFKNTLSRVLTFPYLSADPWGMSIFITSPYLLKLFFLKYKDKVSKFLLITIFVIALPVFLYYGIGARQFGYRYSLDFLPLLFLILMRNQAKRISLKFKFLILISSLFNLYLFFTMFRA